MTLLVQVGDVIRKGRGDSSWTAMICWVNDKQWDYVREPWWETFRQ
jgi:hypothetical protein